jgi:iron-sulfur cluster assembly protein
MNITIKQKAIDVLLSKKAGDDNFLRLMVVKGGCAGLTYSAEIDKIMAENESEIHHIEGIRIVSDRESMQYLDGLVIDYSDDLVSAGLKFSNTKSESTCGCGASFSLTGFPTQEGGDCSK